MLPIAFLAHVTQLCLVAQKIAYEGYLVKTTVEGKSCPINYTPYPMGTQMFQSLC